MRRSGLDDLMSWGSAILALEGNNDVGNGLPFRTGRY